MKMQKTCRSIDQIISVTSTNFLTLDVESCIGLAFGQNVIKPFLALFIEIMATPQSKY
jgi:hypothetical protein